MAIFRKSKRTKISVNYLEEARNERLAFEDSLIPGTHIPSKEENDRKQMIQQNGGFYFQSRTGKTYYDYLDSPENRCIAGITIQEQRGPILIKKKR